MNRAWIELDAQALKNNLEVMSAEFSPETGIMGVVKANGYGHGALQIAHKLEELGVERFCVATLDEAIELREGGIDGFILILGYTSPAMAMEIYRYRLTQTLISYEYALQLDDLFGRMVKAVMPEIENPKLMAHLAIDTGMHRIGVAKNDYDSMKKCYGLAHIDCCGLYTHLPAADTDAPEHVEFTKGQIEFVYKAKEELLAAGIDPGIVHIQNSYGSVNYSPLKADYARFGILMYGAHQDYEDYTKRELNLKPVMTLKAHIASVRDVEPGETVGYGRSFKAERPTKIATICIGYADGVPRKLSNGKLKAIVHGQYCYGAGRICMDQMMLDVTDIPDVKMGDVAILIGSDGEKAVFAEDWAKEVGTISYEIFTNFKRVENNGFVR
ncbi:MAG: alanine racemase [Clostridiales bacterium]|nr:alanine racemase [Clostridiales bacterium]